MTGSKYGKYIFREPRIENLAYHPVQNVKGVTFPEDLHRLTAHIMCNLIPTMFIFLDGKKTIVIFLLINSYPAGARSSLKKYSKHRGNVS
jgi:hypothetical protein